ncbi:site-specific integrase [Leucobacter muris]|uniref:Site-specific integrase n=1 Tax=Leucobacter muris TaxID=1935379 RepID=A0ABX5QDK1_9MICO|nr:site-specific integrase [Leucobacter muris]QAB17098.1 site-specific integrase [Leucobacter muris]
MARAWIVDLWVKDATVTLPDGSTVKLSPTREQMRSIKSLPEHFRTAKWLKGKRWRVAWNEDTDNGPVQRAKLFAGKQEAEEFAAEMEDDIRMGRYIDPRQRERPFSEVAEKWLSSKASIKDSSWRRYRRELDNYVLPKWGKARLGSITREQIDAWVQELREGRAPHEFSTNKHVAKKKRKPGKMAPSYVQHVVGRTFGGTLRYAVREGWIGRDPLRHVELPRIEPSTEDHLPSLTYEEVEDVADEAMAVTGRRDDKALALTLCYCGLRIGEATALKVKDVDLAGLQLRVLRTWTVDKEGVRVLGTPKTWEKRWVPVPQFLADELKLLMQGREPEDYLFRSSRGGAINDRNWYNRVWLKVRDALGIAGKMSVHDLRHVAATLAIAAGADVKLVQQMLGHKDATETLNTYAHLWPSKVSEVTKLMADRRKRALEERGDADAEQAA